RLLIALVQPHHEVTLDNTRQAYMYSYQCESTPAPAAIRSPLARKGDVTCTPSSSKGRLKLTRKKNSRRHGETKFSLRLKSRSDSWMRCCFLKPRILTGAWGLAFGRGKRTRNGITEKSFRSSSIRCSISLRPLRPCAPLLLRRPKPSAFLRAKPREPCVVAKGRTLSKRRDGESNLPSQAARESALLDKTGS